jgi:hypothetical protein
MKDSVNKRFHHQKNLVNDTCFYFLTISDKGKRIAIQKNTDGSFTYRGGWYTGNKSYLGDKVVKIVKSTDGKVIRKAEVSSNITIDNLLPTSPPVKGTAPSVTYTVKQTVSEASKLIQAYTPSELGLIQSSFVTTKYN